MTTNSDLLKFRLPQPIKIRLPKTYKAVYKGWETPLASDSNRLQRQYALMWHEQYSIGTQKIE